MTVQLIWFSLCFFFNDTATTEIYTLSLHDALPISSRWIPRARSPTSSAAPATSRPRTPARPARCRSGAVPTRSEEHTSELQSHVNLVCRLLLEKKKKNKKQNQTNTTHIRSI